MSYRHSQGILDNINFQHTNEKYIIMNEALEPIHLMHRKEDTLIQMMHARKKKVHVVVIAAAEAAAF